MAEQDDMHDLFNRWRRLGFTMQDLSSIVQNDVPIQERELKKWLIRAREVQGSLDVLIKDTGVFLVGYSKLALDD